MLDVRPASWLKDLMPHSAVKLADWNDHAEIHLRGAAPAVPARRP